MGERYGFARVGTVTGTGTGTVTGAAGAAVAMYCATHFATSDFASAATAGGSFCGSSPMCSSWTLTVVVKTSVICAAVEPAGWVAITIAMIESADESAAAV